MRICVRNLPPPRFFLANHSPLMPRERRSRPTAPGNGVKNGPRARQNPLLGAEFYPGAIPIEALAGWLLPLVSCHRLDPHMGQQKIYVAPSCVLRKLCATFRREGTAGRSARVHHPRGPITTGPITIERRTTPFASSMSTSARDSGRALHEH